MDFIITASAPGAQQTVDCAPGTSHTQIKLVPTAKAAAMKAHEQQKRRPRKRMGNPNTNRLGIRVGHECSCGRDARVAFLHERKLIQLCHRQVPVQTCWRVRQLSLPCKLMVITASFPLPVGLAGQYDRRILSPWVKLQSSG